jgi:hypothetical protein
VSPAFTETGPQDSLGVVTGKVQSGVTGFAVEGCRVQADRAGRGAGVAGDLEFDLTFPDGSYRLELPPGRYTIRASGPAVDGARLAGKATRVKVVAGTVTTADIVLAGPRAKRGRGRLGGFTERTPAGTNPSSGQVPAFAGEPERHGPMPALHTTAEVAEVIGHEQLAELRRQVVTRFLCWKCEQVGPAGSAAISLVVVRYRDGHILRFAHADCTPPLIVEVDAGSPVGPPPPCREGDNHGILADGGAWFTATDQPVS